MGIGAGLGLVCLDMYKYYLVLRIHDVHVSCLSEIIVRRTCSVYVK